MAGLMTGWVFKDCTGMPLYWLSHLTVFFVASNICTQLLWILAMQAYSQGHHDFRRFYQVALCRYDRTMFLSSEMLSMLTTLALYSMARNLSMLLIQLTPCRICLMHHKLVTS